MTSLARLLTIASAVLPAFFINPTPERAHTVTVQPACPTIGSGNLSLLTSAATAFISDSSQGTSLLFGVPFVSASSLQLYTDPNGCAMADSSYRAFRVSQGRPNVPMQVSLLRLGQTGFYFGTAFMRENIDFIQYIIFDSTFAVRGTVANVY